MTGRDKLRQMSNEELAEKITACDCFVEQCPCNPYICADEGCYAAWMNWLNREVDDEEDQH